MWITTDSLRAGTGVHYHYVTYLVRIKVRGTTMGKRVGKSARLGAKRRQASKLAEIRKTLIADGFDSAGKQAIALGVSRPTAWALLNRDKKAGPSAMIIKRILSSPSLPPAVRRKVEEYVAEKIAGLYGHHKDRTRWFRDQFASRSGIANSALGG